MHIHLGVLLQGKPFHPNQPETYCIIDLLLNSIVVTGVNPPQIDKIVDVVPLTVVILDMTIKLLQSKRVN